MTKRNQLRPSNVAGKGDTLYKVFNCPTPGCEEWLAELASTLVDAIVISCPACNETYQATDEIDLYEFDLIDERDDSVVESGVFTNQISEYVDNAPLFKYCIICGALKPLEFFDQHSARKSGRQGECRQCKKTYNAIKNQTRIEAQHREASQKRRLYVDLAGNQKIDVEIIRKRFDNRCFKCGKQVEPMHIDHTLPVKYLWPANTENATLLCSTHNGQKSGAWPNTFYSDQELRTLATRTGIDYKILRNGPIINPEAIHKLKDPQEVENIASRYAAYVDELDLVRNRVLDAAGFDFYMSSPAVSEAWVRRADKKRNSRK